MRKSRFTERQIVVISKQAGAGVPVQDLIRKHGIRRNLASFALLYLLPWPLCSARSARRRGR